MEWGELVSSPCFTSLNELAVIVLLSDHELNELADYGEALVARREGAVIRWISHSLEGSGIPPPN
jgi:hypothetical protein